MDREYIHSGALPDWLNEFADKELQKEGNPFDDIKELFKSKNDVEAVDARVEELCERVGLNKIAEKDKIHGGFGDSYPDERYDKEQLEKGIKVELEHTNNPKTSKEIAKDHLEESKDYKGSDGGKYYDKLEELEENIEEDVAKKKAQLLINLITFAQALEDNGMPENAALVDEKIKTLQNDPMFAKDKEIKELPKKYEKYKGLDEFIQNACRTSGGFASTPAIQDRIRNEFDEDVDVKNKDLEKYIKYCLENHKKEVSEDDQCSGEYVAIIVTEDSDDNQKVFDEPSVIK